jgi:outer membrane protein assembly factor BamB
MFRNALQSKLSLLGRNRLTVFLALGLTSGLLSACAGGAPNQSWGGLAVKGDLAYLAHNAFISAVRLDSGQKAWQYPEKADLKVLYYADPLIDSNGDLVEGAYNGSVVKLDAATGSVKWTMEGEGGKIIAPIAEGPDGAYYASSDNGDLLVIDPASGTLRQRITLKASSWGPMAVDDRRIYVATIEHKVFAVNFTGGSVDWASDLGYSIAGGINLVDGKLVVGTFGDKIIALSPDTGEKIWEASADGWVWQAPVITDSTIFAADLGGAFRAIALADGNPVWRASLSEPIQASPVLQGDKVFVGTSKGKVHAYSIAEGVQAWEGTIEGGVYGSIRTGGDKVLVVVNGGKYQLAALSADNGTVDWTYVEPT